MYEEWFNLKRKPFELVPNPDFLFQSKSHKKATTYLNYGIRERAGFILLTGEVGSGKTTLVRNLIRKLERNTILSLIFNTKVTSDQLIALINEDFGLDVAGKNKVELFRDLNTFLVEQYANGCQPILIIDEAQNLSPDHLEEVRLLSNLETDSAKLLQIILVGQPELQTILARPELRQLRQRISISSHIQPLTRLEMEEYIFHRLEIAGNRAAIRIAPPVFNAIHNFSRGIPRLVNIMCDFLLIAAYAEETQELSPDLVNEVLGEIEIEHRYWEDEISEENFSINDLGLKSVFERISEVENKLLKSNISQEEKAQIFERISEVSKSVDGLSEKYRNDISQINVYMSKIMAEVESLRSAVIQTDNPLEKNDKKKEQEGKTLSLWKRMSGGC